MTYGRPTAGTTLEARGVTKTYGRIVACHEVSLRVEPGEVVGLLGQNGAGKSTLLKVIRGLEPHDSGSITYAGETLRSGDHRRAHDLGIAMVHQELSLVGALSVWENVALAQGGTLRRNRTIERICQLSDEFSLGLGKEVDSRVDSLPVAIRQRIEIAKCLVTEPRLMLLDEPTATLSREEATHLFGIVRRLVDDSSIAVLVSSHRLGEILDVADRVVVLRNGAVTGEMPTSRATEAILAREMLGGDLAAVPEVTTLLGFGKLSVTANAPAMRGRQRARFEQEVPGPLVANASVDGGIALEIHGLSLARPNGATALSDLSLTVARGEIVGIVGADGNGQTELVDVLSNRRRAERGTVVLAPLPHADRSTFQSPAIGVVPSDRHRHGCVLGMSVAENLFLGNARGISRHHLMRKKELSRRARQLITEYGIECEGPDAPLWTLSGGHQQRVVLARELAGHPSLLVVDQPTRGLDVAAVEAVWSRLRKAAADGAGVLLISSDLIEVLHLAARILVISRGSITGQLTPESLDAETLGLMIGGSETSVAR